MGHNLILNSASLSTSKPETNHSIDSSDVASAYI